MAVKGIVKNELQAIVTLGGILGFMVGVLQTFFSIIIQLNTKNLWRRLRHTSAKFDRHRKFKYFIANTSLNI